MYNILLHRLSRICRFTARDANRLQMLDLIQLETGKTRTDAFSEVVDAAVTARYYARRAPGMLRPRHRAGLVPVLTDVIETRRPVGVVGVVAPWNYPLSMGISEVLPALLAGNAVVVRPDPSTSLTMLFVAELLARAGLPQRALQVVLGDGPTVGGAVLAAADYVCFTGSTRTGRQVAVDAAWRLVGASLELGGKNPMYVAVDADLDRAVPGAIAACFVNAGQVKILADLYPKHLDDTYKTPAAAKIVRRSRWLQKTAARVIGTGLRPERV